MGRPINISNGDVEEIIPRYDGDKTFIVEVEGTNPVRVAHAESDAREGTLLPGDQRHTVANLQGQGLHAAAVKGDTTLRVSEAAADVRSQPEESVKVGSTVDVSDRAAREVGKVRVQDSGGTLVDPATDTSLTSSQPRSVDELTGNVDPSAVTIDPTNSFAAQSIGDGVPVALQNDPANGNNITVEGSYVLQPGDRVTLYPDDLSNITTSGTGGDSLHALIGGMR